MACGVRDCARPARHNQSDSRKASSASGRPVASGGRVAGRGACEGAFFQGEVGVQVNLNCVDPDGVVILFSQWLGVVSGLPTTLATKDLGWRCGRGRPVSTRCTFHRHDLELCLALDGAIRKGCLCDVPLADCNLSLDPPRELV
jgi:hypothetical protein